MKKIIALILAFCLSLSILPVFADETEVQLADRTNEVSELNTLGIIKEDISKFDGSKTINRGNFAKRITTLLNMIPEHIYYDDIYYHDVPEEHEYFLEIMHCAKMSWMSGYGNNMFLPENDITLGEALKVLISVLGYGYKAEAQGGYVTGYITVANELGLLKGIKSVYTDTLILNDFVKLLDNALTVPLAIPSGIKGDDGVKYDINPDVTVLSRYHNMVKGTGIVTANDTVVIEGQIAPENEIIVNGISLKLNNVMDRNYLGHKVNYIYKENQTTGVKELLVINDAGTDEIKVELKNFEGLKGNTFYYTTDGYDLKNLNFSSEALFIKNGEIVANPTEAIFDKEKIGTVTFVKYGKSDYNLIIIKEYDSFVVGKVNNTEKTIYDFSDYTNLYTLDETEKRVIITDSYGKQLDFSGIKVNKVVSVAEGLNKEVIEVIVSEALVTDKYTSKNDSTNTVTIGNTEYKLKNAEVMAGAFLGSSVSARIDAFGYIVYAEAVNEEGYQNAIYIKSVDRTIENENVIIAKLYMTDGTIKEVKVGEKISINGETKKNITNDMFSGEFTKTGIANPMFKVKFNEKGDEIINIIVPKKRDELLSSTEDGFCVLNNEYAFTTQGGHFGLNVYTNASTPFVQMPASIDNVSSDDFLMIVGHKNFVNGQKYNLTAYFDSKYDIVPVYVQIPDGSFKAILSSTATIGIVSKFSNTVDEYGSPAKKIYLYQDGKETGYMFKDTVVDSRAGTYHVEDLQIGDTVIAATDSKGNLTSFMYIYQASKDTMLYSVTSVASANSWGIRTISKMRNGYAEVKDETGVISRIRTGDIVVYVASGIGTSSANIKKGSIDDLEEEDKILYFLNNGQPVAMIKYQ